MQELKEKVEKMISMMGFRQYEVSVEPTLRKISVNLGEDGVVKSHLSELVLNLSSLIKVMSKKAGLETDEPIIFDVNNYRKERDNLIIDLAKAAARKALATKEQVSLPPMNAYERRLVHAELSMRPDVKTESLGEGKSRYVVVKIAD